MKKLMEKAKENYIKEGYQRLANIEATREWGKSENIPLPKYQQPKIKVGNIGWLTFFKQILP